MFLEFVPETSALSKNNLGCYTLCCFLLHKTYCIGFIGFLFNSLSASVALK